MRPQAFYQLPADDLLETLCTISDEIQGDRSKRDHMKKRFRRAHKHGHLYMDDVRTTWLYWMCVAEIYHGRYHWTGWESRSEFAHQHATDEWMLPKWDGRKGAKLFLLSEQGLGDEILFSTCLPDLLEHCPDVVWEVDDRLIPIFRRTYPQVRFVTRYRDFSVRQPWEPFEHREALEGRECYMPAGQVPKLFRTQLPFPRDRLLKPDPDRLYYWMDRCRLQETIGVAWGGRLSSLAPESLLRGGGMYVNLQYDGTRHDAVVEWPQSDLDDTFALIASLDALHCAPITPAHMAGAVGTPCRVVRGSPIYGDENGKEGNRLMWAWPLRRQHDWYPSVKVYNSVSEWTECWRTGSVK